MYGRAPSSDGHSIVNCRKSVKEFRNLRNPSVGGIISLKSPTPSSTK